MLVGLIVVAQTTLWACDRIVDLTPLPADAMQSTNDGASSGDGNQPLFDATTNDVPDDAATDDGGIAPDAI